MSAGHKPLKRFVKEILCQARYFFPPYLLIRANKQVVRLMSGTTFLPFPYCLIRENKRIVGLASGIVFPAALIS